MADVRLAGPADVAGIVRLAHAAMEPPPTRWYDRWRDGLSARFAADLEEEPAGAWVAEDEGGICGAAISVRREGIWVLKFLAVHPGVGERGLGRRLVDAALSYADGCRAAMIAASDDPRALRLYSTSGFDAHPCLAAGGPVDHARLGQAEVPRRGDEEDLDHCVAVDRDVRGGGRRVDLERLVRWGGRLFVTPDGYAVGEDGRVDVLAAREEGQAVALLHAAVATAPPAGEAHVPWLSGRQNWAVRAALDAGLVIKPYTPYFTRGELGPLTPWIPNGALL